MKRKIRRILATVLLMTLVLVYGFGPALAQEQMKVNINTATLDELCTLKRIGPSYAQRIIDYRTENGPSTNDDFFFGEFLEDVVNDTNTVIVLKLVKPSNLQPQFKKAWKLK